MLHLHWHCHSLFPYLPRRTSVEPSWECTSCSRPAPPWRGWRGWSCPRSMTGSWTWWSWPPPSSCPPPAQSVWPSRALYVTKQLLTGGERRKLTQEWQWGRSPGTDWWRQYSSPWWSAVCPGRRSPEHAGLRARRGRSRGWWSLRSGGTSPGSSSWSWSPSRYL